MAVGTAWPAEWRWSIDAHTGRAVQQMTGLGSNYHLYFYNPSVTPDGRTLVFYSDRTGVNNLFRMDLANGEIVQLTDARPVRADYWPFTPPIRGAAACLAVLGDQGRTLYYFEGNALRGVNLHSLRDRHVLIHPTQPHRILFCHEFTDEPDRMWLLDTSTGRCAPVPGQAPDEWYQHEFWSTDGERVCFHDGWHQQADRAFCGWCDPAGNNHQHFSHGTPGRGYAHYNLHPSGQAMITDGEAHPGCISRVHLRDGRQKFEILCRHDSYEPEEDQRCHPHPSFTPDGRRVVFTANHDGQSNIYFVDWDKDDPTEAGFG